MNTKLQIIIGFILFFYSSAEAQKTNTVPKQWTYEMYKSVSYKNFRSNPLFNQKFVSSNADIPLLNAALFFMVNEQRAKAGRDLVKYHPACEIAAYNHSKSMVESDFFSHTNNKNRNRETTEKRGKLAGISNPSFAENIAYNYPPSDATYLTVAELLIKQWMNSSGHKANILSDQALQAGCGAYANGNTVYATQVFQWFNFVKIDKATDSLPNYKDGTTPKVNLSDFK